MSSHTNHIFIEANPNKDISVPAFRIVDYSDEGAHFDIISLTDSTIVSSTGSPVTDYGLHSGGSNENYILQANVCECDAPSTNYPTHSGSTMSAETCKNKSLIVSVLQQHGAQCGYTVDEIYSQINQCVSKEDILDTLVCDRAFRVAKETTYGSLWVLNELFLANSLVKQGQKRKHQPNRITEPEQKVAELEHEHDAVERSM